MKDIITGIVIPDTGKCEDCPFMTRMFREQDWDDDEGFCGLLGLGDEDLDIGGFFKCKCPESAPLPNCPGSGIYKLVKVTES
jgi:hypothetical protein